MEAEVIDTKEKLLAVLSHRQQIEKVFALHKHTEKVLCLVKKEELQVHIDKFQEIVSKSVATFGGAIIEVTRKDMVTPNEEERIAIAEAVENLYEKPVEVELPRSLAEVEETNNPFADDSPQETEEPKKKRK
jgi:hypothetical protein